jgi:DNA repair exonuclease SbcCD ATPase subunit
MKNIEAILTEFSVEIPEDKKADFLKAVGENYKPVADWQHQKDKVDNLTSQLNTAKDELKKFEGVDAEDLKQQISDLNKKLSDQENDYKSKIADRDFDDLVGKAITKYKGVNAKAIKALLDIEALKGSKNQEADVDKAIDELTKADDSKMLFGSDPVGTTNPIGKVGGGSSSDGMASMRAIMGLPPENSNNKGE